MKIYVLRHGQTDSNIKNVVGGINEDINLTGKKQAEQVKDKIQKLNIDLIICSPSIRTRNTCKIINSQNIPVLYDKRIIERDVGKYENVSWKEIDRKEFWNYYSNKYNGLESMKSVYNRVFELFKEIKEKYVYKNILLITHGGTARAIYWCCKGIPKDGNTEYEYFENCEIKEYEI